MNEELLDQISPLIDLRRYICNLSMSSLPSNTKSSVNVELLPQVNNYLVTEKKIESKTEILGLDKNFNFGEALQKMEETHQAPSQVSPQQ